MPTAKAFSLKNDWKTATSRVICSQFLVVTKKSIVFKFPKANDFLETNFGTALVLTGIGFAFSYVPKFKKQMHAQILAGELQRGTKEILNISRRKLLSFF